MYSEVKKYYCVCEQSSKPYVHVLDKNIPLIFAIDGNSTDYTLETGYDFTVMLNTFKNELYFGKNDKVI